MNRPARAALHSVPYLSGLAVFSWAFARWLGSGTPTLASLILGVPLMIAGFALSSWCVRFLVTVGEGTQSPLDPTTRLVSGGPYRYVRNPMILGNLLLLLGAAALFRSPGILLFTLLFWAAWHLTLVRKEEPSLRRRFGPAYNTYQQHVPRWLPRFGRRSSAG